MRKALAILAFAACLLGGNAEAQVTCGQYYTHPGPDVVDITLTGNLVCPHNSVGVYLGDNTRLNLNGYYLADPQAKATAGAGVVVLGRNSSVTGRTNDLRPRGQIVNFFNGIVAATTGQRLVFVSQLRIRHTRSDGMFVAPGSALTTSYVYESESVNGNGVKCLGECYIYRGTLTSNAGDGMVCQYHTGCGTYKVALDGIPTNARSSVYVLNGSTYENQSCPGSIYAQNGGRVTLKENPVTCVRKIRCTAADATSHFYGDTFACK